MAIKQLKLLSTTEIADGSFRSLTEVEKYLETVKENLLNLEALVKQYQSHFAKIEKAASFTFKVNRTDDGKGPKSGGTGGRSVGLEKIHVPKLDSLRKNFSVIEELHDQVDHLDSLYNDVATRYQGVRGANDTLKNIKAMQKAANAKVQAALAFLNTIGTKYAPTEFRNMVEDTITYVKPNLTFRKNETFIYAYETPDEHLAFSIYIKLYGLEDDEGHQHAEFYIVFTCVLKPSSEGKEKVDAFYYVTAMNSFAPPGKYLLGRPISDPKKAANTLGIILEMENVSTAIGLMPHNLDPNSLKKGKFSVGSLVAEIKVDPNMITFIMLKSVNKDQAEKAAASLYREVLAMVNPPKPKKDGSEGVLRPPRATRPRVKIGEVDGRFVIQFTLNNMARQDQISLTDIDTLLDIFPNLDERKLRQVVKVINSD